MEAIMEQGEKLDRVSIQDMDALLGMPFFVLDSGFVRVVDYMGGDESVVQAARVSYGRGTKRIHEDRGLIRYLMRHNHTTPFEMCEIKLHVRVPMDCWRQWVRHRTANVNEYSTRYSVAIDIAQVTKPDGWRKQSSLGRQGSEGFIDSDQGSVLSEEEEELQKFSRRVYENRLRLGNAREQARKDLPLSTYTEAYWKIDLHNLLHFLRLRMDSHAQDEIRSYATCIGENIVSKWCPIVWEAFLDYKLNQTSFSKIEIEVVKRLTAGDINGALSVASSCGILEIEGGIVKRSRERSELEAKLFLIGVEIPW
jgi:thymidylate synthase (FAD)